MQPNMQLLHVILVLLEPADEEALRSGQTALAAARARKSFGVYESCRELLQGFLSASRSSCASTGNPDDRFQSTLLKFLDRTKQEGRTLAQLCQDVFETYWELAQFFEEPSAVYPPPKNDTDNTEDMFHIFYRLGEAVSKASSGLRALRLREEMSAVRAGGLPFITAARKKEEKKEAVTDGCNLLVTPPTSPTKGTTQVGSVASPSRTRTSSMLGHTLAQLRLRKGKDPNQKGAAEDSDRQSDVSDWEPSLSAKSLVVAPATSEATPELGASEDGSRRRRPGARSRRSLGPRSESSSPQATETSNFQDSKCPPAPPAPARASTGRQSLAFMADRFEQRALARLGMVDEDFLDAMEDFDEMSESAWLSCPCSPNLESRASSTQSRSSTSSVALSTQLRAEAIRRKLSRGRSSMQTPHRKAMGAMGAMAMASLTPVEEPGETPGCRSSGLRATSVRETSLKDPTWSPPLDPEPRCLWRR